MWLWKFDADMEMQCKLCCWLMEREKLISMNTGFGCFCLCIEWSINSSVECNGAFEESIVMCCGEELKC